MGIDQRAELSEFLRTRRARLQPKDVGLVSYGRRRRVPGLRREELAQLAGVSVAYYTRLEQGHGHNVSAEIIDAIATALRLSEVEREHLTHLVKPVRRPRRAGRAPRVRPGVQQLIDQLEAVPAYVIGFRTEVLAWNRLACALVADFPALQPQERNVARLVFLDPGQRELYVDWEAKAADVVSALRVDAGCYPDDPQLCALIGELSMKSEEFRELWARHDVREKRHGTKRLQHPVAGPMELAYEVMRLPDDAFQHLLMFHAEPGSPSAEALRLLASWGTDRTAGAPASP